MFDRTPDSGDRPGAITVATATRWPIRVLLCGVLAGPIVYLATSSQSVAGVLLLLFLLVLAYAIDSRVGAMRLGVSPSGVEVVNFMSSHVFDLESVNIETEEEQSHWPADDLPRGTVSGNEPTIGSLHLSDGSGRRLRVGVVPSYGRRAITIIEDLKVAIARHRL